MVLIFLATENTKPIEKKLLNLSGKDLVERINSNSDRIERLACIKAG